MTTIARGESDTLAASLTPSPKLLWKKNYYAHSVTKMWIGGAVVARGQARFMIMIMKKIVLQKAMPWDNMNACPKFRLDRTEIVGWQF